MLDLPPISKNMIPESSLPIGGDTTTFENDPGVTISSVDPTSTTAALAANVPLEAKHTASEVPEVIKESQKETDTSAEGRASASAVKEKTAVEEELKSEVPPEEVPQVVKESIIKAHVDPEATANPEAVHEKKEVESELLQELKQAGKSAPAAAAKSAGRPITPESPAQPESKDISPMSKPTTTTQTAPTVTSDVAGTTAGKATEAPQTPAAPGNDVKTGAAESSKPSPTSYPADKKKKRFSWLGKMKEKLHLDKDK
jgi:hypothetical protein